MVLSYGRICVLSPKKHTLAFYSIPMPCIQLRPRNLDYTHGDVYYTGKIILIPITNK